MSLLTVEVEIVHGVVTPKEPHLLPEKGVGLLTVLASALAEPQPPARRERVQLPLVCCQPRTVIHPTKDELDASLWD